MSLNAYYLTFEYHYHVLGYPSIDIHHDHINMYYIYIVIYIRVVTRLYLKFFCFCFSVSSVRIPIIVANWLEHEIFCPKSQFFFFFIKWKPLILETWFLSHSLGNFVDLNFYLDHSLDGEEEKSHTRRDTWSNFGHTRQFKNEYSSWYNFMIFLPIICFRVNQNILVTQL